MREASANMEPYGTFRVIVPGFHDSQHWTGMAKCKAVHINRGALPASCITSCQPRRFPLSKLKGCSGRGLDLELRVPPSLASIEFSGKGFERIYPLMGSAGGNCFFKDSSSSNA